MHQVIQVQCPDCGRTWQKVEEAGDSSGEVQCRDCAMMVGWHKDFASPPSPGQWQRFKQTGEK